MSEVITGRGINQADLISLLNLISTNFRGVTVKLDLDGGVAYTAFTADYAFTVPVTIGAVGIFNQGAVLDYLKTVRSKFDGLLTKMDADLTISDSDYNATLTFTTYIDDLSHGSLLQAGVYEGALVKWFSRYITNFNAMLTKLDADAGVSGTNYSSLWAISTGLVDATGCVDKP